MLLVFTLDSVYKSSFAYPTVKRVNNKSITPDIIDIAPSNISAGYTNYRIWTHKTPQMSFLWPICTLALLVTGSFPMFNCPIVQLPYEYKLLNQTPLWCKVRTSVLVPYRCREFSTWQCNKVIAQLPGRNYLLFIVPFGYIFYQTHFILCRKYNDGSTSPEKLQCVDDGDKRPNRKENFEAVVKDKDANMTVDAAVVEKNISVTVESVAMEKYANMSEYTPWSQKEPGTGSFQTSSDLGFSFKIGHCVAIGLAATMKSPESWWSQMWRSRRPI